MLAEYELVCPMCGNLREECSNPKSAARYPQRSTCHITAVYERTMRKIRAHHGHPDPSSPESHFLDGVSVWMSKDNLTPEDTFGGALAPG